MLHRSNLNHEIRHFHCEATPEVVRLTVTPSGLIYLTWLIVICKTTSDKQLQVIFYSISFRKSHLNSPNFNKIMIFQANTVISVATYVFLHLRPLSSHIPISPSTITSEMQYEIFVPHIPYLQFGKCRL